VTAVTGVFAVIAVIAGIVSSGPVRAARTVAKGPASPVTAVSAGRLRRDLRAGRDRRDSSRCITPYLEADRDRKGPSTPETAACSGQ
jgi:hypothetical protein